jgi:DNA-binding transcriptional regulator/RsmH inhibitor MraZ
VFQQYLKDLGEQRVFMTTLDERTAQIYPMSVWKENEKFFEAYTEDPQAAEDIAFTAYDMGDDGEPDGEGRLLLPQQLRRTLGLECQPVWLHCYKGRINVYSGEVYEAMQSRAAEGRADKLRILQQKGLK